MEQGIKLYRGDECFYLFKNAYYHYCNYSVIRLKKERDELYEYMVYANDYYGVLVRTICILINMKKEYEKHEDKFCSNFWFEVFIKKVELPKNILARHGIELRN